MALDPKLEKAIAELLIRSGAFKSGVVNKNSMKEFIKAFEGMCQALQIKPELAIKENKARVVALCFTFHHNKKDFENMMMLLFKPEALLGRPDVNFKHLETSLKCTRFFLHEKDRIAEELDKCMEDLLDLEQGKTPKPNAPTPAPQGVDEAEIWRKILHGEQEGAGAYLGSLLAEFEEGIDEQESTLEDAEGQHKKAEEHEYESPKPPGFSTKFTPDKK